MEKFVFLFVVFVLICTTQVVNAQVAQDDLVIALMSEGGNDNYTEVLEYNSVDRILSEVRDFLSPFFTSEYWMEYLKWESMESNTSNSATEKSLYRR